MTARYPLLFLISVSLAAFAVDQSTPTPTPSVATSHSQVAPPPTAPATEPFHRYFFRIPTRQGRAAPGRRYDCISNGNRIGCFASVAWPDEYGNSGIMTFVVNQRGRVFQKDLGPHTEKATKRLGAYDPDGTWTPSPN